MIINEDEILGEGCSSVVKKCILKDPNYKTKSNLSDEKARCETTGGSSPLLNRSRVGF